MMTSEKKPSRSFIVAMVAVVLSGIAIGVISQMGFSLAVLSLIVGGLLLWGIVWGGGFQLGSAFADWLERRWNR